MSAHFWPWEKTVIGSGTRASCATPPANMAACTAASHSVIMSRYASYRAGSYCAKTSTAACCCAAASGSCSGVGIVGSSQRLQAPDEGVYIFGGQERPAVTILGLLQLQGGLGEPSHLPRRDRQGVPFVLVHGSPLRGRVPDSADDTSGVGEKAGQPPHAQIQTASSARMASRRRLSTKAVLLWREHGRSSACTGALLRAATTRAACSAENITPMYSSPS